MIIGRLLSVLFLWVCASGLFAATPDPITFGWAVERGNVAQVRAWLDAGLDPEFQGGQHGTGLMIAAWHGNLEMMALFVERGANPRRSNRNGEQALQLAAWNGHLAAVKWLLAHGAVLNREGNAWGALHYAVFNGHAELARYLIAQGAEVNARSPNGTTPLMLAAREGREEMIKTLLEAGGDPKSKNEWGDTALTMAMRYDHFQAGKMIASPEEFAIAVKAPRERFGEASRSAAAPSEVEVLLNQIREAEAQGHPAEELRKQLQTVVHTIRQNAMMQRNARRPMPLPAAPKSIVITARRNQPGAERVQLIGAGAPRIRSAPKPSIQVTPVDNRATQQARIAEIMRQIRLAEAQGAPSERLKQELYEAVESLNK